MTGFRRLFRLHHILHGLPYSLHRMLKHTQHTLEPLICTYRRKQIHLYALTSSNFLDLARSHTWLMTLIRWWRLYSEVSSWMSGRKRLFEKHKLMEKNRCCEWFIGAFLTIRMSSVMINSDGLLSVCLLWGRGGPRPKIPLTRSRRDSLLGCLFIFKPVRDTEWENERYFKPPGAGDTKKHRRGSADWYIN